MRAGSTKLALELSPKLMRFHVARWIRAKDRLAVAGLRHCWNRQLCREPSICLTGAYVLCIGAGDHHKPGMPHAACPTKKIEPKILGSCKRNKERLQCTNYKACRPFFPVHQLISQQMANIPTALLISSSVSMMLIFGGEFFSGGIEFFLRGRERNFLSGRDRVSLLKK